MLLKYTFRNIFSKPGRLAILLTCMTVACLAGFLAVDFSVSLKQLLMSVMTEVGEAVDYKVTNRSSEGITDDLFGGFAVEYVGYDTIQHRVDTHTEEDYRYVTTDIVDVFAFSDTDRAMKLGVCPDYIIPKDGEISITESYSYKYQLDEGSVIVLTDADGEEIPLTVAVVFPNTGLFAPGYSAVVSAGQMERLTGKSVFSSAYVDLVNDDYEGFAEHIEKDCPEAVLAELHPSEDQMRDINSMSNIIYLTFVLVFVLVVFVTISFTEKIITERMSVIGTLRSVGMSMWKTTRVLLFENVMYALMSSAIALMLYLAVRNMAVERLAQSLLVDADSLRPKYLLFLLVIAGAILIQVVVPLYSVMKAAKTSIRDIIFDTRDSEYTVSVRQTVAGAACLVVGLVFGFACKSMLIDVLSILMVIVGGTLTVNFLVRKATLALSGFFARSAMPVVGLAAYEAGSKKPNASNAVLTVAAVTAASAIFVIGNSMLYSIQRPSYQSDVIVTGAGETSRAYDYIKEYSEVQEIEYVEYQGEQIVIDGNEYSTKVLSLPEGDQYIRYGQLPERLEDSEVLINSVLAEQENIKPGDSIAVRFHSLGVFPVDKELTVCGVTEKTPFGERALLVLDPTFYRSLYPDEVKEILIRTDDPDTLVDKLDNSFFGTEKP